MFCFGDLLTLLFFSSSQLTMNDFSVHRIIGRGGFGEVYGCRKADTGKMYAMKCLDKKRIKMKQGETLALNERIMLSLVSTGVSKFSCFECTAVFVKRSYFSGTRDECSCSAVTYSRSPHYSVASVVW